MTKKLTIAKPDDWHLHLRDGIYMADVVHATASVYKRALVMPNLQTPVSTVELAKEYRGRILDALGEKSSFNPHMALYLTAETKAEEIEKAFSTEWIIAIKLYPAGATTNSAAGVQSIDQCDAVFEKMQEIGMPLSIHGEVTDPDVDIFDKEKVFIETVLVKLIERYPDLKIIFEHITTKDAVQFIQDTSEKIVATITPHHLLLTRNDIFKDGITPHNYCLPVVKTYEDQKALIQAATCGNSEYFLGTDSAPHAKIDKEKSRGKAGIYSAPISLALYAEVFEKNGSLENLEGFASHFGADFYGLTRNTERITLEKTPIQVPQSYPFGDQEVVPMLSGQTINWQVVSK